MREKLHLRPLFFDETMTSGFIKYCNLIFLDYVRKLFTEVKYSSKGSNERMKEEAVFMLLFF